MPFVWRNWAFELVSDQEFLLVTYILYCTYLPLMCLRDLYLLYTCIFFYIYTLHLQHPRARELNIYLYCIPLICLMDLILHLQCPWAHELNREITHNGCLDFLLLLYIMINCLTTKRLTIETVMISARSEMLKNAQKRYIKDDQKMIRRQSEDDQDLRNQKL